MLGKKVYFCDKADWKVKCGWAITHYINEEGYGIYVIVDDKRLQYTAEEALVFESEALAQAKAIQSKPESDAIVSKAKELQKETSERKIRIIGKPTYTEAKNVVK